MKKTLTRVLTLVMVLAMLVSVMPFAMADENNGSVAVTADKTELTYGQETTVTAAYTAPEAGEDETPITAVSYKWTGAEGSGETATFKATQTGEQTVSVEVTLSNGATVTGSCKINVKSTHAVAISIDKSELLVSQEATLTVEPAEAKITYEGDSVTVDGTTVKAVKAGTATITATVGEDGDVATASCTVTVADDDVAIQCDDTSIAIGRSTTLKPTLNATLEYSDVKFSFEKKSGDNVTVTDSKNNTCAVVGNSTGLAEITVTAIYTDAHGKEQTITKDVRVRVYGSADIEVTANASSFTFETTGVFSAVSYNGTAVNNPSQVYLAQLFQDACQYNGGNAMTCGYKIVTTDPRLIAGTNKLDTLGPESLKTVQFKQNAYTAGDCKATFYITDVYGLTIAEGTLTIRAGSVDAIHYATDYATNVTLKESDFEDFWYAAEKNNNLSYVTFETMPTFGTLWTTSAKTWKVTSGMKFKPNYTSSTTYEDLSKVTYVPDPTKKASYTDTIGFTVHGTVSGKEVEIAGSIIITLNGGSLTITMRGTTFQNAKLTETLSASYKEATGGTLSYVTFVLPEVEDGRLYYAYDGIMNSQRIWSTQKFYVTPGTNEMALDKVCFVPAADCAGTITLYYKAYGSGGSNEQSGSITFTVTKKTSSGCFTDITASSYSWAADAADFLYYEGISQGSDGKYSPGANITRGDFMLMLYRAFLEDRYQDYTVTSNFSDVVKGTTTYSQETYQAVGVAKYLGIAQGDGSKFNPKSYITRQEAMALIYRTLDQVGISLEYKSSKTMSSFTDASSVSSWAQTAISDLISHGIVVGSAGKINPKSNISRAEMAVILHRVLTY